jgi:hypothetical protein
MQLTTYLSRSAAQREQCSTAREARSSVRRLLLLHLLLWMLLLLLLQLLQMLRLWQLLLRLLLQGVAIQPCAAAAGIAPLLDMLALLLHL